MPLAPLTRWLTGCTLALASLAASAHGDAPRGRFDGPHAASPIQVHHVQPAHVRPRSPHHMGPGRAHAPPPPRYGRDHGYHRPPYARGDRLPPHLYTRNAIVHDWRRHRLSPPPRGYQWVRVGRDALLVARGSGRIAQVAFNFRR